MFEKKNGSIIQYEWAKASMLNIQRSHSARPPVAMVKEESERQPVAEKSPAYHARTLASVSWLDAGEVTWRVHVQHTAQPNARSVPAKHEESLPSSVPPTESWHAFHSPTVREPECLGCSRPWLRALGASQGTRQSVRSRLRQPSLGGAWIPTVAEKEEA